MNIKTILFSCLFFLSNNAISQVDSTAFLKNVFDHANRMKTALTTDNIMVLYEFLKSENNDIEVFEIFKRKTISVYHNENYEYDFGISNIILEKPLVYSYKNQMLQCVVRRKTIFKNSNEVITTNMWYYSTDGKNLKYDNFSLEIDKKTLLKSYPFIDLKLFDKI
jgi:hypothetical protein